MHTLFEKIVGDLSRQDAAHLLDDCMSFDPEKAGRVPVRSRILSLGFVKKWTAKEVNEKLKDAGCELLYARNFQEMTLLYAYNQQIGYEKWKQLHQNLKKLEDEIPEGGNAFLGKNIALAELEAYVKQGSLEKDGELLTYHGTRLLEEAVAQKNSEDTFKMFLEQNIREFSTVREKSRYYFCKYLLYFIKQKIQNYLQAIEDGFGKELAMEELLMLKGISELGRKKFTPAQAEELLSGTSLSCGGIYDLFNQFYFEYVSSDWMDILLEYYGDIESLGKESKAHLARSLRSYNREWSKLSDDEVVRQKYLQMEAEEKELDAVYSLEGSNRGYQKNRSGERSVRNYIRGTLDLDRTTLISYLLFFGYDTELPEDQEISVERLNEILRECHMGELQEKFEFDQFVIHYLNAEDPQDYLMEAVTNYAFQEKNFFLYHMYNESVSNQKQIQKIMG